MEDQELSRLQIFVLVGIQLTLLASIGSCSHAFLVSSEGGECNSNSDVKGQTMSGFSRVQKYITATYFEKHDSLIDTKFQNFAANELPLGVCGLLQDKLNLVPRLSVLHRYLIGEGSHRHLSSSFRLSSQPESIAELPRYFCKIIIVEKLPSGIFADPFELEHLLQRGVFTDAAVFGDTNLELPSVVSNRSVVEVHLDVDHNIFSGHRNGLEINLQLPLHARYAVREKEFWEAWTFYLTPLGESGFSRVVFNGPDLFLRCNMEGKSHEDSCLFTLTGSGDESQTAVWKVPCGIKEHSRVVSVVTFASAVVSAFFIVLTSIYYPHFLKSQ